MTDHPEHIAGIVEIMPIKTEQGRTEHAARFRAFFDKKPIVDIVLNRSFLSEKKARIFAEAEGEKMINELIESYNEFAKRNGFDTVDTRRMARDEMVKEFGSKEARKSMERAHKHAHEIIKNVLDNS